MAQDSEVQQNIASDEMKQFDKPLSVSTMAKVSKFPMLQELGFNGSIKNMKDQFHGVKDWFKQMDTYSGSDTKLMMAWKAIKKIAIDNGEVMKFITLVPGLGQVGLLFKSIGGYAEVFSTGYDALKQPSALKQQVTEAVKGTE